MQAAQDLHTLDAQNNHHLCTFIADDRQYHRLLADFVSAGLSAGDLLLILREAHTPETILAHLEAAGIPAQAAAARGQLVIHSAQDALLREGQFDPSAVRKFIVGMVAQTKAKGYPAMRGLCEMDWAVSPRHNFTPRVSGHTQPWTNKEPVQAASEVLIPTYEALMHAIPQGLSAAVVCMYDRRLFAAELLSDVFAAHRQVLVGSQIYRNLYFLPYDISLPTDRASIRLDHWIENLATLARIEKELDSTADVNPRMQLAHEVHQRMGTEHALKKVTSVLHETEDRYRRLFDLAADAIMVYSLQGDLLQVNQTACLRYGYQHAEMLALNLVDLVPPALHERLGERLNALLASDTPLTFENVHLTCSGEPFSVEVHARIVQYDGQPAVLAIVHDLTRLKESERVLRESAAQLRDSETRFRNLVERAPISILLTDEEGILIEWNTSSEDLYQIPAAQALNRPIWDTWSDLLPEDNQKPAKAAHGKAMLQAIFASKTPPNLPPAELRQINVRGQKRFVQLTQFTIPTEKGFWLASLSRDVTDSTTAQLELERYRKQLEEMVRQRTIELEKRTTELQQQTAQLQYEINERLQVEAVLRESEGRYRALVNEAPLSISVAQDNYYVFANPSMVDRLGYSSAYDLIGRNVEDTLAPNAKPEPGITAYYRKDRSVYYSENNSVPIFYQGRPAMLIIGQDVSERLRHRQQLETSLAEKEVMLREIHHRVKNNLNIIIALIDLQKAGQMDPQVLEVFRELQNRAHSMALVHESLYRSPNLAQIDFAGYLRTLADYLLAVYGPPAGSAPVRVRVEAESTFLKIETAIPCGLLVNELVTNALKYAFPHGCNSLTKADCEIVIQMAVCSPPDRRLSLTVCDNGVGLPPAMDWRDATTLGLQLVQILARQVGGEMVLRRCSADVGTAWELRFPAQYGGPAEMNLSTAGTSRQVGAADGASHAE